MITPLKKGLLIAAGIFSLIVGIIGAFLPLIPTVPLVLLSAFCFARSSEHLHGWLLNHPHLGVIVANFEAGQGIPKRVKVRAITVIWISMGLSAWIVGRPLLILMLTVIGLGVTLYLWRMPEPENKGNI